MITVLPVEEGSRLIPELNAIHDGHVLVVAPGWTLEPGAVECLELALSKEPAIDVLYGDDGGAAPFYKPAWSPERLRGQNYLGGAVLYRTALLRAALEDDAALTADSVEVALHAMALGVTSRADVVRHIPELVSSPTAGSACASAAGVAMLDRHFGRTGFPARATIAGAEHGVYGFEPVLDSFDERVSLIVPTGGGTRRVRGTDTVLVDNAIESVLAQSRWAKINPQRLELVIVLDQNSTSQLAERMKAYERPGGPMVTVVKDERPFNFAAACNLGVEASSAGPGDLVVMLNDDTEVVTPDWIERLLALTNDPSVGAAGVKLLYGDGRVQHAGVLGRRGGPGHTYHGYPGQELGHGGFLQLSVNLMAATGACLAIRREKWDAVEGMEESLPLNYNDIDLCMKLRAAGHRIVVDNQTVLTHLETSSRESGSEQWEVDLFAQRWPGEFEADPYDSPNFTPIGMEQIPKPADLVRLRRLSAPAMAHR